MALHRQQREVFDLLRDLSGQRAIIYIPRLLVRLCGGYEEAAMLSQILYWSHPDKRGGWFYKTRGDWAAELELTEKQVRRARTNLEILEFIKTKQVRVGNSPATWYRPCPEAIVAEYEKHRPERSDHRPSRADHWPQGAGAAALLGNRHIITQDYSPDYTQDARAKGLDPEEQAEMDRLWEAAKGSPIGQLVLGFMKSSDEKGD